ncbi:MAG: deoxynucleoside kinase [Proteobacteria bacterium]|nr:deoxynucleoside kinase [Pseudomonadota bacterium]
MADRFVAVAGNIGVGKTSLVKFMHERYGFEPFYEPFATNPYLDDFYKDMKQWSFHSQMWFLTHKYKLHRELERTNGTLVQDRTIYEDAEIFAQSLYRSRRMKKRDWETYLTLYEAMKKSLKPPDLTIYLRCSVRAIRKRIKKRGRESEQDIPAAYLRRLNGLYEEWYENWDESPKLVWESEELDYVEDLEGHLAFRRAIEPFL